MEQQPAPRTSWGHQARFERERKQPEPQPLLQVAIPTVELSDFGHHEYSVRVSCAAAGTEWLARHRYREFLALKDELGGSVRALGFPPKVWWSNKEPAVVSERRGKLEAWLRAAVSQLGHGAHALLDSFLEVDGVRLGEAGAAEPSAELPIVALADATDRLQDLERLASGEQPSIAAAAAAAQRLASDGTSPTERRQSVAGLVDELQALRELVSTQAKELDRLRSSTSAEPPPRA